MTPATALEGSIQGTLEVNNPDQVEEEYGLTVNCQLSTVNCQLYDAVVLAVAHQEFLDMDVKKLVKPNGVIYDVKGVLPREIVDGRL